MSFTPFAPAAVAARGTGTSPLFGAGTTGDANNRVEMDADGFIRFGSGAAAPDSFVGRSGVNVVQTSPLNVTGVVAASAGFDSTVAGFGVAVKEGSNAKQGTAVLVAGSVVVANTSVTANSRIFLTSQADGGAPGFLRVSARTAGTSFTITSSSGTDTSTVAYEIFEPG